MNWTVTRLKHVCVDAGQYGLNISAEEYVETGPRLIRTSDVSADGTLRNDGNVVRVDAQLEERHRLEAGDILLSRSGTLGRALLVRELVEPCTYAGYLVRFRPKPTTEPRFLAYVTASREFQAAVERDAISSTIQNFNAERYANISLLTPPLDEQRRIADFLDAETTQIDAIRQLRQRQIAALKERAASYISKLVTCGDHLDTTETTNPWIPRIALGWDLLPLKRRWQIIDCKHRTPNYVQSGYPVISPGDITPGRLDISLAHRFVNEEDFRDLADEPRRARRGDIVYSRNASVGIAAYVATDDPFTMGQDVCRITSQSQSQLFLSYFLNTVALAELGAMQIGSTFSRVNISNLLELSVACPPPNEQVKIANLITELVDTTAKADNAMGKDVALLAERKQALITAAVTGQIDVTTTRGADLS